MSTTIKFDHGTSKKLEFDNSGMGLLGLLSLGALELTTQDSYERNGFQKKYGTDIDGLKKTSYQAEQILMQLHSSIEAVSNLAANANLEDVPESIQDIFYLIGDLTKLASNVTAIKSDIDFSLEQQGEKS